MNGWPYTEKSERRNAPAAAGKERGARAPRNESWIE